MIEIFHDKKDADAHIKSHMWRQHSGGYFLNYRGPSDTMLHLARCSHFSNEYWDHGDKRPDWERGGKSMTAAKKICSMSRQELEDWARKNGVSTLKLCKGRAGCF